MGRILFYLLWPFVWFYTPLFVRGRGILLVDGQVLVVKNWFGPGMWQLPGGGIKFGEKPLAAINRELTEELGIDSPAGRLITQEPVIVQSRGLLLRQFYAVYSLDARPEVAMSRELVEYQWMDIQNVPIPHQVRKLL